MSPKRPKPGVDIEEPHAGSPSFPVISRGEVPKGRDGKHRRIVARLLHEIAALKPGTALKVPLTALPDSKENIRSALNRTTHQRGINIATSSDERHLYIWHVAEKPPS
jgi:hypothetical protein